MNEKLPDQEKYKPPLMSTLVPVRKLDASDARYNTRSATSPAWPSRFNGVPAATLVRTASLVNWSWKLVLIIPGHTQFTRIFDGPSSFAMPRVNVITAPFDAAYVEDPGPPPSRPAKDAQGTRKGCKIHNRTARAHVKATRQYLQLASATRMTDLEILELTTACPKSYRRSPTC